METEEFLQNVKKALQTNKDIDLNTNLLDLNEWDSLGMVSMVAMFDEKYGKKVSFQKLMDVDTVNDLQKILNDD